METKEVLNIEEVKHLHELGLPTQKNQTFMWFCYDGYEDEKEITEIDLFGEDARGVVTYTAQEVLNMLPKELTDESSTYHLQINYKKDRWEIVYYDEIGEVYYNTPYCYSVSLIDAAYEMPCYCLKNNLMKK